MVSVSAGSVQAITGAILSYSPSASAPNLDPIAFKEAALARLRNLPHEVTRLFLISSAAAAQYEHAARIVLLAASPTRRSAGTLCARRWQPRRLFSPCQALSASQQQAAAARRQLYCGWPSRNGARASKASIQPLAKSALIVSKADGVASVSLNHRPVNALTQGVCEELRQCLGELEADPQVRGLLLGSALPGLFSAGLDLHAFHKPDPDALADYWTAVQELWLALWTSDLATVAAISGHCPAGGCM
ncbi:hypothetical protein EMIHUDRAFT_253022, partial [Emiliania huxleyi CCMP1516]|uniref:Uncharacterized protein n=2 Tax=Emiliania huxleyi TaxID=2903 RepID=A0A0D3KDH5_EMIH1